MIKSVTNTWYRMSYLWRSYRNTTNILFCATQTSKSQLHRTTSKFTYKYILCPELSNTGKWMSGCTSINNPKGWSFDGHRTQCCLLMVGREFTTVFPASLALCILGNSPSYSKPAVCAWVQISIPFWGFIVYSHLTYPWSSPELATIYFR